MATSEAPEAPAWEWTTDEQAELEQLRESTAELQNEVDRLRGVQPTAGHARRSCATPSGCSPRPGPGSAAPCWPSWPDAA